MKTKLKTFLMALVIVPCAFIFAACGGDQLSQKANINVEGDYQTATAQNVQDAINAESLDYDTITNGMHLTFDLTMTIPAEFNNGTPATITANVSVIYNITETENGGTKNTSAMRLSSNGNGENVRISVYTISEQESASAEPTESYYVEMSSKEMSGKWSLDASDLETLDADIAELIYTLEGYNNMVSSMTPNTEGIEESILAEGNEFEIATTDNTTKIKIKTPEIEDVTTTPSYTYYVFEDGVFKGMKIENLYFEFFMPMTINATMVAFDGEVELPDFSKFTDELPTNADVE